jgi:hypothetical protein
MNTQRAAPANVGPKVRTIGLAERPAAG